MSAISVRRRATSSTCGQAQANCRNQARARRVAELTATLADLAAQRLARRERARRSRRTPRDGNSRARAGRTGLRSRPRPSVAIGDGRGTSRRRRRRGGGAPRRAPGGAAQARTAAAFSASPNLANLRPMLPGRTERARPCRHRSRIVHRSRRRRDGARPHCGRQSALAERCRRARASASCELSIGCPSGPDRGS